MPEPLPLVLCGPCEDNFLLLPDAEPLQILIGDFVHVVDVAGEQTSCEHEKPMIFLLGLGFERLVLDVFAMYLMPERLPKFCILNAPSDRTNAF